MTFIFLAILIFGVNVIPAFMPPTWTILAFFYIKYHLPLVPLIILGASFATLGRITLSLLSRTYFRPFLSKNSKENMNTLGLYVNSNKRLTIPLLITYAFLPIPSNQVYIAAGLAKVNIKLLAISFFIGRLISYTFWVSAAHVVSTNINSIFLRHFTKTGAILIDILGFLILYLITKISWRKILKITKKK